MTYHGEFETDSGACGSMVMIGERLRERGVEVDYFTFSDLPAGMDPRLKSIVFPFKLWQHVRTHDRWDAIDAATGDSWVFHVLGHSRNRPLVIVRSHGLEQLNHEAYIEYTARISWKYWFYWGGFVLWSVDTTLKGADHVFVLNERERDYVFEKFGRPCDGITVAYHFLPRHFQNLPPYTPPPDFRILYVGSWLERKGIVYLCTALEALIADGLDFSLTLAGLGTPEAAVRSALSDALNQRTRVIPKIANADLPAIYRSHSVYVFPSLFEGYGKTLVEAIACGIPVITTEAGIAPDFVGAAAPGQIVPYHDAEAIRRAIVRVYRDPDAALATANRVRDHLMAQPLDGRIDQRLALMQSFKETRPHARSGRL